MSNNLHIHDFTKTQKHKEELLNQKAKVLWLFGLSGSGKSTIANELESLFYNDKKLTFLYDGDSIRNGINSDLSFTQKDRDENLRRIAEISKLTLDNGVISICCFITPLISQRKMIKKIIGDDLRFIYINTDLKTCENRDPKGLYAKARSGEIKDFTGISSDFETDNMLDLEISTDILSPHESALKIYNYYLSITKN